MERHGCVKEFYYEKPQGTWSVNEFDCSDRKIIKGKDGWTIIAYGPYGGRNMAGADVFFAPMQYSGCSMSLTMKNFILIDPGGDVRYVYDDGFIYKMMYE